MRYSFSRSPTSTLRAINAMVQDSDATKPKAVKRILIEDGTTPEAVPSKVFAKRLQDYIEERQQVLE